MSEDKEIHVHKSQRQIIERKLLMALNDDDKVAVVLTEQDLDVVIRVFQRDPLPSPESRALLNGFERLQAEAYE